MMYAVILAGTVVWLAVLVLYAISLIRRDFGTIDNGWASTILLAGLSPLILTNTVYIPQILLAVMLAVWAVRLSVHIIMRGWGKGEDSRYAEMRASWGQHAWFISFFKIFVLQGVLMFIVALPAVIVSASQVQPEVSALMWLGVAVWAVGFLWESIADYQLSRFKQAQANHGRVLKSGLWEFSRHPNYFGEVLLWWGIAIVALSVAGGWLGLVSPLLMTFLLLKVSGVPLLEARQRRNPQYREYARHTPAFIPKLKLTSFSALLPRATLASSEGMPEQVKPLPPVEHPEESTEAGPRRRTFKAHAFRLAEAFGRGSAEQLFKKAENKEEVPFSEMPEMEQVALMNTVRSLVAELRDISRTPVDKEDESDQFTPTSARVVRVGGVIMRLPGAASKVSATLKQKARSAMTARKKEITERLAEIGSRPGVKKAYAESIPALYLKLSLLSEYDRCEEDMSEIDGQIDEYLASARGSKSGVLSGGNAEMVRQLRGERAALTERLATLSSEGNGLGREVLRVREIQSYAEQIENGMLADIPTVRKLRLEILENMRTHQHYLIAGHLGGGKTELAKQCARQFMREQGIESEPEVFSGSDEASVYDLIGKLKLKPHDIGDTKEMADRTHALSANLLKHGIQMPPEKVAAMLMGQGSVVETVFAYGPVGRALRDGRPVILDEINLMRPEVLGRLNALLTERVGKKVRLQENGDEEFEIKPGFVVIGTLNLGSQYAGVKDFNAAQKSRWTGREMDYPRVDETFDIMLANLLRKDRAALPPEFPPEAYEKLVGLALVTRETQELFSGKTEGQAFMSRTREGSARAVKQQLRETVISPRDLLRKVIDSWKDSGFSRSLDELIAAKILAPSKLSQSGDEEQKFMTEIFLRRGFFEGWTSAKFAEFGVSSVSDEEIRALQGALTSGDFAKVDAFADAFAAAKEQAGAVRTSMLLGNRAINSREE